MKQTLLEKIKECPSRKGYKLLPNTEQENDVLIAYINQEVNAAQVASGLDLPGPAAAFSWLLGRLRRAVYHKQIKVERT